MSAIPNIRVLPVVVIAVCALAVLKVAGLVLDGGYVFDYDAQTSRRSWAQENLNYPGREETDITGATHGEAKETKKEEAPKPAAPETKPEGVMLRADDNQPSVSPSEKALL